MNKTIFIFMLMLMALDNSAYSAESVAKSGENQIQASFAPGRARLGDKYFFSLNGDANLLLDFPRNIQRKLDKRANSNVECAGMRYSHRSCEEIRPTYLNSEEMEHVSVKPGYYVVGISGFNEIYRGCVANLRYKLDNEDGFNLVLDLMPTSVVDPDKEVLYIMAEKQEDLKDIRGFLPGEYEVINDKKVLDKYREMLIEKFSTGMEDYEWQLPDDVMRDFGKEYEKVNLFGKLQPEVRKKLLEQWLVLDARKITLPKVNGAFIKFGIRDLEEKYYLLLGSDFHDLYGSERYGLFGTMFVFNSNIAYVYVACGDTCSDYLRIINASNSLVQDILIGGN